MATLGILIEYLQRGSQSIPSSALIGKIVNPMTFQCQEVCYRSCRVLCPGAAAVDSLVDQPSALLGGDSCPMFFIEPRNTPLTPVEWDKCWMAGY